MNKRGNLELKLLLGSRQLLNLLHSKCLETVNVFQKNWGKICEPKGRRDVRWD